MAQVQTLGGPIDTGQLGTVLMHEHIFNITPEIQGCFPGFHGWDPDVEIPKAQQELKQLKEAGYDTILELSVVGLGRDVNLMAQAIDGTGLQVIVSTGLYTYDVLPRLFHFVGPGALLEMPEPLDDLFARDIEEGIQGTDIKAAFLKCAVDEPGITEDVGKVLRACARASKRTGRPLMVHSHPGTRRGLEIMDVLDEEGVDPATAQIAHTGDTDDLDYIEELLERGPFIGMDRYGTVVYLDDDKRNETVIALLERGHVGRMFLSTDACMDFDWFPREMLDEMVSHWKSTYILDTIVPQLRAAGMTDEQLDEMLVENPKRWLGS
jgi:phosphotriesterase-related protein